LQDEVARRIAEQIRVQLTPEEQRSLTSARSVDPEAHEAYLKGLYFWNKFTLDGMDKSVELFNQAIERDPKYALAYTGLARAYGVRANLFTRPSEDYPKAKAAAVKALELDDTLTEAHEVMGAVHLFFDWDWAGAEKELSRAQALNPNDTGASVLEAYYLEATGRTEGAIPALKRGAEIDPLSPLIGSDLGFAYYYARRPDEAIVQFQKTLEIDPNFGMARFGLAAAHEKKGEVQAAFEEYRKMISLDSGKPSPLLAHLEIVSGKRDEAQKTLERLKERSRREYVDPLGIAHVYAELGDKDAAFELSLIHI